MPPKDAADAGAGYAAGVKAEVSIARARADVAHRQAELEERGLVSVPRGNVSTRVAAAALFVIAPAESAAERVSPERTVLCDLEGVPMPDVPGSEQAPSADLPIHAEIYRAVTAASAIVHTDSPFAVAWATRGEDLPSLTVAAAEEFGAAIPVVAVALEEPRSWGEHIAAGLAAAEGGACLVVGMGVFAVGTTLREATRRAAAAEVAARHACLASQYAPSAPRALTADTADLLRARALRDRLHTPDVFAYGPGLSHN